MPQLTEDASGSEALIALTAILRRTEDGEVKQLLRELLQAQFTKRLTCWPS